MHDLKIEAPGLLSGILREQGFSLKMSCGGHGSCKTCRVMLDGEPVLACQTDVNSGTYGLTVPQSNSGSNNIAIDLSTLEQGLACKDPRWKLLRLNVKGSEQEPGTSNMQRLRNAIQDDTITIHPAFMDKSKASDFEGEMEFIVFENMIIQKLSDDPVCKYAFAVDIGTTTIAAALVDLETVSIVGSAGRLNGQYAYAEDLVARIAFCHTEELLQEMQDLVLKKTLAPLLKTILKETGVQSNQIITTILSGNAPMIHILLGYDPSGMGGWPFNGVDYAPAVRSAMELRLPGKKVEFIPSQSAYLGADIISGLALIDFENVPDGTLFVDLGTNAEMALKYKGDFFCTAVPAGPSFEGGGFPCGISAIPGAIDHFSEIDGNLSYTTLDDLPPLGICGSGIVSFVASAFRAKILRKKGRLSIRHDKVCEKELLGEVHRVYSVTDDIYISEDDISNFLQAKAAVFSGVMTLCKVAGADPFKLSKLFLAGNFGSKVRLEDLMSIGIIPQLGRDSIAVVGNTSLKGAIHAALDQSALDRAKSLTNRLQFIDLNAQSTFQNDFINALFIPHLTLKFD